VGRRLILDTNVLIAYERGTLDRAALDEDELAVAAVSIAEYRAGLVCAPGLGKIEFPVDPAMLARCEVGAEHRGHAVSNWPVIPA
jgi:predicted nucleic acid-binding protein